MIQVGNTQVQAHPGGKPVENVQKDHGIGTAGDAHENPVAVLEHFFMANGICHGGYQWMGFADVYIFRNYKDLILIRDHHSSIQCKGLILAGN